MATKQKLELGGLLRQDFKAEEWCVMSPISKKTIDGFFNLSDFHGIKF